MSWLPRVLDAKHQLRGIAVVVWRCRMPKAKDMLSEVAGGQAVGGCRPATSRSTDARRRFLVITPAVCLGCPSRLVCELHRWFCLMPHLRRALSCSAPVVAQRMSALSCIEVTRYNEKKPVGHSVENCQTGGQTSTLKRQHALS